ncbi:protein mono-ADP-ribosyltransferase PARP12b [Mugil cephalus]|uniref:protein mono-ADP-ribosyltransferase PARP12b n=1 Tax=Mugil cephalus TaxID=48193 RepID=UPI001FB72948|nr:protein mono-ADP-ribosyltransferase PARP12b [Mugil cephalus]
MFSREVLGATVELCGNMGSMPLPDFRKKLQQHFTLTDEDFRFIVKECSRFLEVRDPAGVDWVVARTSLRLCRNYGLNEPCRGCQQLHLCKFFLYGTCRFGKGRKPCKFSHDVQSEHNYPLLRECSLHQLDQDLLFRLLLQNDPALLPEVCVHYNQGPGPRGLCSFQDDCSRLHLCQHFLRGECLFGRRCRRLHAVDGQGRRTLEERGLSGDIVQHLPFIYRNSHFLSAADKVPDSFQESSQTPEICLHFIRNSCRFHNDCRRVHFHLPYKWEVFDGSSWTELEDLEDIERDFCDPSKTQSGISWPVDFLTMTCDSLPVRRLSTVSSVTKPSHYSLTTEWRWYFKGDRRTWVEYGAEEDQQSSTSVTSQTLEAVFQSDRTAEVPVVRGTRQYLISFTDMYQRNLKHNTKRRVRRRPRFLSSAQVDRLVSESGGQSPGDRGLMWDVTGAE